MTRNPVENDFVTRFLLVLAVIGGMMIGGRVVGELLVALEAPAGAWIGTGLGAVGVFVAFAAWYVRYDASFDAE